MEVQLPRLLEEVAQLLVQMRLIGFEPQHVVPALVHDLFRQLLLAAHGIHRHHRSCVEESQQGGRR
jgi:hypothetical protein